jgi:HK97 family phage major capsid protein
MNKLEEARTRLEKAIEEMDLISDRLNALPDDSPVEIVEAHQERFNDCKVLAKRAKSDFERQAQINEARKATLPEGAYDEQPGDGTTDTDEPAPVAQRTTVTPQITYRTPSPRVSIVSEALTYVKDPTGRRSYFRDLVNARLGDRESNDRLHRHAREVAVERRDLSSTDGVGGEFVPPLWLMDEYTEVIRMGRPFANAVNQRPLPPGTDSISIPKILTGSSVAAQADLGAVSETDPTTGSVTVPVRTLAGQVDVARQVIDRQPIFDDLLFADLIADYNLRLDLQCLTGSGSGANAKGVLSDSNRITVTYTDASPTVGELYSKIQDAIQQIVTNRGLPPTLLVVHPRRWGWIAAASDSSGRPLIVPTGAALNSPGSAGGGVTDLGRTGFNLAGLDVLVDANIPTNQGAGTNEDVILVTRASDLWLMEDAPVKTRTDESVLSNNLTIRLQAWNYFGFTSERYSKSTAQISGTGLVAPTF